jgi:hypothetical protein
VGWIAVADAGDSASFCEHDDETGVLKMLADFD